jgi:hypothetical protein
MRRGLEKVAQTKLALLHLPVYHGWLVIQLSGRKYKETEIVVACWNVRSLIDSSDRMQRKTAILARELNRYRIEIAAVGEKRLADEGQLSEVGAGFTIFWKGRPSGDKEFLVLVLRSSHRLLNILTFFHVVSVIA